MAACRWAPGSGRPENRGTSAPALPETAKKRPPDLPRVAHQADAPVRNPRVRAQGLSPMAAVICASAASLPST